MPLQAEQINDLIKGSLRNLGPPTFTQIAQDLQSFPVMSKWFKKEKVNFDEPGYGIQRNLMTALSNQAQHVGLIDLDQADIPDLMAQMNIPWRHVETKYAFIDREIEMNRGKALVFNVIKPRRMDALISLAKELETRAWQCPSSSDTLMPYGVPYWVVYHATTGFNGSLPSGHTAVAGINSDTVTTWKNYSITYSAVTKQDLGKKLRTGLRKVDWTSPVDHEDYRKGRGEQMQFYTTEAVISGLEDLCEAQNENLGRDLATADADSAGRFFGMADFSVHFRRHPFVWVPHLDAIEGTNQVPSGPIYGLNHATFFPVVMSGYFMAEDDPIRAPNQRHVYRVFTDTTYNYLNIDRRRNLVCGTAAAS